MKIAKIYINDGKTTVGFKIHYDEVHYLDADVTFLNFYLKKENGLMDLVAGFVKKNIIGWVSEECRTE